MSSLLEGACCQQIRKLTSRRSLLSTANLVEIIVIRSIKDFCYGVWSCERGREGGGEERAMAQKHLNINSLFIE